MMVLIYFVPQIFEYLKKFDTNLLSHRTPGSAEVETLFSPITIRIVMGENRVVTPALPGVRCDSTFEPESLNFCMTVDFFVPQIMISSGIPRQNVGIPGLVAREFSGA